MMKKQIKYGSSFASVSDFEMESKSEGFMYDKNIEQFLTSSSMFIDFCRVIKKLHPTEIDLEIIIVDKNGKETNKYKVDNDGRFEDCPKEFDFYADVLAKLF